MCALPGTDSELQSLRSTFYDEADERLIELEAMLLELDGHTVDAERMNSIFRAVHSIKGGSAACELASVVRFAHTFESLLDALRKGRMGLTPDVVDVMLLSSDVLAMLVNSSRNGDETHDFGAAQAVERIRWALEGSAGVPPPGEQQRELAGAGVIFFEEEEPPRARLSARAPMRSRRPTAMPRVSLRAPPRPWEAGMSACADGAEPQTYSTSPDDQDDAPHSDISEVQLARMVALAIDLQQSSARLSAQLGGADLPSALQLSDTARQIASEVGELESLLTAARGGDSATLLDCIVIRVAASLYAIPLSVVRRYFTLVDADLRTIPVLGRVLLADSEVLPVLQTPLSDAEPHAAAEPTERVAISLSLRVGPAVLVVDEVLAQVKLLVRKLEANFQPVQGILGAAPYGSRVLLVLDLEAMSHKPA